MRKKQLQIRTLAAIIVWVVVALLLLNRFIMSEWITPIAIVLTVVAVLIYFSSRIRKKFIKKKLNKLPPKNNEMKD